MTDLRHDPAPFADRIDRLPEPVARHVPAAVESVVDALHRDRPVMAVLIGGPGSGRTTALHALATDVDLPVLRIDRDTDVERIAMGRPPVGELQGRLRLTAWVVSGEVSKSFGRRVPAAADQVERAARDAGGHLVVLIDDAHLVDPEVLRRTADAVREVNQRGQQAVSLVATHPTRPMEESVKAALRGADHIHLQAMDVEAVRDTLAPAFVQRAGGELQADPRVWIAAHAATGGWPPAVQRFGAALWEAQADVTALGEVEARAVVRETVSFHHESLRQALDGLSPEALRYLGALEAESAGTGPASREAVVARAGLDPASATGVEGELRAVDLARIDYAGDRVSATIPGTGAHLRQHSPHLVVPADDQRLARLGLVAPRGLAGGGVGTSRAMALPAAAARGVPATTGRAVPAVARARGKGFGR